MADPTDFECPVCGAAMGVPCQRIALIPLNHNQRIYLAEHGAESLAAQAERDAEIRRDERG